MIFAFIDLVYLDKLIAFSNVAGLIALGVDHVTFSQGRKREKFHVNSVIPLDHVMNQALKLEQSRKYMIDPLDESKMKSEKRKMKSFTCNYMIDSLATV